MVNFFKIQQRHRHESLCMIEAMTLLVAFHQSGLRTFQDYYTKWVPTQWCTEFPGLVGYNRFIELIQQSVTPLELLARHFRGKETGVYLIDSTPLPTCHIMRRHQHQVFKQIAKSGKTMKLAQQNLSLITKKRKNMAERNSPEDEQLLKKRGTIESVIEQLKFVYHNWHTRHLSILNAFANLYAGIVAYALKPQKPFFALTA